MKKRLLSLLLSLCMTLSLLSVPAAATGLLIAPNPNAAPQWLVPQVQASTEFPDVTGTWCESYVDTVYRAGLMSGKTAEKFDATSDLTYAQITVICARLYELLTGGDGLIEAVPDTPWYQPSYDLLVEAGVLSHEYQYGGPLRWYPSAANDPCRRRVFVNLLGAVLDAANTSLPELNQVSQIPDYDAQRTDHVYDFYRYGILNGADPYGGFHPESYLTRGAAAAMLSRIVNPQERLEFELPSFDVCTDLLGIDHKAVLLIVDGTEVTAEQMAHDLAYWLSATYTTPDTLLENAIHSTVRTVAEGRLAQELKLSFDRKVYENNQDAQKQAGFMGITPEGQIWAIQNTGYGGSFIDHFLASHGEKGYTAAIDNAIEAKAKTLSVERSELLNSLDLNALHAKCRNSPYG